MKALERVLSGREDRARLQGSLLSRYGTVVQISLNIPGLPKTFSGDRLAVTFAADLLRKEAGFHISLVDVSLFLDNGAGCSLTMGIESNNPVAIKRAGIRIEDTPWGAILDIDVMTIGGAIHRKDLYGNERKCLICDNPAKICARMNRHSYEDLRNASKSLLSWALDALTRK